MVTIEGRGLVSPSPAFVPIDKHDLNTLREIAAKRDQHRNYANANSTWARGLRANPILVGLVGELAIERFFGWKGLKTRVVDPELNDGDGGKDALIHGKKYQIKTSGGRYETCLVRRCTETGRMLPLVADRFIFCSWSEHDVNCEIIGWCKSSTLTTFGKHEKAKRGSHWNIAVPTCRLLAISDLPTLIKQEQWIVQ